MKKGRPRLRWIDEVEQGLRNMRVKRWRSRPLHITGRAVAQKKKKNCGS
jgi:hypothetical protein